MTAEIIESPAPMTDQELIWEGMAELLRVARLTSHLPATFIKPLRSAEACEFPTTVNGLPVTVSKHAGALSYEAINDAWEELRMLAPPAGSHVHITDGRALPDIIGGAA